MNETDATQEPPATTVTGRRRVYAPWMIGVLILFVVCECLFVTWRPDGIGLAVIGLMFAVPFCVIRYCRANGWTCLGVLFALFAFLFMAMMLFPAISASSESCRRTQCANNLKQLGLAVFNYESDLGQFPPAFVADEDGKPMHSWRTLILPFIEEQKIYYTYDFQKPWDSPENQGLAAKSVPYAFQCPSVSPSPEQPKHRTDYVAVLGEDTFWRPDGTPRKLSECTGGLSNTAMLIEIKRSNIPWHEPRDVMLDDFLSGKLSWSGTAVHEILNPLYEPLSGRHIVFGDGRIRFTRGDLTPDQLRRLFSITEPFDVETELPCAKPRPIVFRHVVFYLWLATLLMQFLYIFFPVRKEPMSKASTEKRF